MAYGIWLSYNNQQEGFQVPVNPSSIEMSDGSKGATYDIVELGEISVIKHPKLTTYRFSSIFPAQRYPFVDVPLLQTLTSANESSVKVKTNPYVDYITRWMATKRPIRFVFTGDTFDINEAVSIESFDWKEAAGSSGDIEYTLALRKYVFYSAQRLIVKTAAGGGGKKLANAGKPRADDREKPKTYTLRAGDTLWKVAKSVLGNGDRWREIQKLNGLTDAQLKKLAVGKVLKLPT
ncbi:LysM peptidoglycan-binding domain-containing protein [Cohnella sp. LGH]|uniref:LysM peptidoglycan-binding domain-containing protein n=1 Tax=Cohnella sp. LGH TaxID=1619153 RepID=UPI001ADD19E3|nr:LysM peptidoglycan-binding domain-containing protein [Cohnella sp. LGH]QTH46541.1 LysM peptidoglycan-binding domain-containing protein [Cohnella sp. LGH]